MPRGAEYDDKTPHSDNVVEAGETWLTGPTQIPNLSTDLTKLHLFPKKYLKRKMDNSSAAVAVAVFRKEAVGRVDMIRRRWASRKAWELTRKDEIDSTMTSTLYQGVL